MRLFKEYLEHSKSLDKKIEEVEKLELKDEIVIKSGGTILEKRN